jgi:2-polyprenyl-3-methyl-5-hydroxy-6-metoxy-1,4-benzoquinol methylase
MNVVKRGLQESPQEREHTRNYGTGSHSFSLRYHPEISSVSRSSLTGEQFCGSESRIFGSPRREAKLVSRMSTEQYWEKVYRAKAPDEVSWFRPHLETSLALIERAAGTHSAEIIDVGGGESTLLGDLIARGYRNLTCLDISETALEVTKKRLGQGSQWVHWIHADITRADLPKHFYHVWHDRAVFHFLTTPDQRLAYVRQVASAVKPGGHVIVATFGPEGPVKCSGLDVSRYDAQSLHGEFGPQFRLVESATELHHTPSGTTQQFLYCYCVVE